MDPLKVGERYGGVGIRQMTVAARGACWLAGWLATAIYGSRHTGVYFCLPVCLERRIWRWREAVGQSVRYCVSYQEQLFCLEGRQ